MKIVKRICKILLVLAVVILGCFFYTFKIEPYRIKVNQVDLEKQVKNELPSLKIVQFSDTHIKEDFTHKNFSKVVDKINLLNADFVIFTGDLYDNHYTYNDNKNIISQLSRIKANYGKVAIRGNRDHGGGAVRVYEALMTESDFVLLTNESKIFTIKDDKKLLITGIDDSMMGNPQMPSEEGDENIAYRIFLSHEPDVIEDYPIGDYNLVLSGHTHGGQFDIPFLPFINEYALSNTEFSTKYKSGINTIGEDNQQLLYINTGIGTTHIPGRFGVAPEITMFRIYNLALGDKEKN